MGLGDFFLQTLVVCPSKRLKAHDSSASGLDLGIYRLISGYEGGGDQQQQPSKSGTEIWIQNALQQKQKKHSTASLNLPARGVAEGCVDYHKAEWGGMKPPKPDQLAHLLESMSMSESRNGSDHGSPPHNGDGGQLMPPGFAGWHGNGYALDFNKNKILPLGRCGAENAFPQSMLDKLFEKGQEELEAWNVAATPTGAKSFGVGAIGEGRRRSTPANQSGSGSDDAN
ncbi:hypothetical protein Ciccas_000716 [Cichlidogyrus casuarinus]|uniref:Uncharacterized protein n=1 Tax=Cichlidogyrus casuarinus TaxID=1844966 RepID=A0ABD2QMF3_9PLAT